MATKPPSPKPTPAPQTKPIPQPRPTPGHMPEDKGAHIEPPKPWPK